MAEDTSTMDDAALDALLDSQYGDDGQPSDGDNSDSGSSDNANVSPSDDIEDGQSEEEDDATHVDEPDSEDEDPEDSLSTDEDEDEDDSEESDEDNESSEDNSEDDLEDDSEADEEPLAFQPLRADGKEYPIENMQELYSLASKGINADRKWNDAAEGRKLASTLKKNGLTQDDINMLIELKKGDKNAIASLLKGAEIDPMDIDVDALDGNYRPNDHSTDDFEMELDDVVAKVKNQPRYQETVSVIMDSWDKGSKDAFYKNPQILELLNVDMQIDPKTGTSMYDRVTPVAEKMKALETGVKRTDLEYYQMAGAKVIESMQKSFESKQEAQDNKQKQETKKQKTIRKKKKAAASSGGTSASKKVVDVTEMSDEELDAFLEKTS